MDKLELEKDLKFGREELLLDPNQKAKKCGYEVNPLLANDLSVRKEDGTYINLVDYITQENLRIGNLKVSTNGINVVITWDGEPTDVEIKIDNAIYQPTAQGKWEGQLTAGSHTVTVKATKDFRGLTESFTVVEPVGGENIIITFN